MLHGRYQESQAENSLLLLLDSGYKNWNFLQKLAFKIFYCR